MEDIQFLQGHQVERAQDRFLALEVAAFVEHEAAPGKTRPVGDDETGNAASPPRRRAGASSTSTGSNWRSDWMP